MLAGTEFMAAAVILIVLAALVLFITEWLPLPVTAMSVAVAFYLIGAVDASTALKSFSSSTAMIIAAMAIIGEAVFKTGGAEKIGEGMKVCGISCITNLAAGMSKQKLDHKEVQETADRVSRQFKQLVTEVIKTI